MLPGTGSGGTTGHQHASPRLQVRAQCRGALLSRQMPGCLYDPVCSLRACDPFSSVGPVISKSTPLGLRLIDPLPTEPGSHYRKSSLCMERQVSGFISHHARTCRIAQCCAVRNIQSATSPCTKHLVCAPAVLCRYRHAHCPLLVLSIQACCFHAAQTKSSPPLRMHICIHLPRCISP